MFRLKLLWVASFACLVTVCIVYYSPSGWTEDENGLVFAGSSQDLSQTAVVATLEEPIPEDKNAVWSAAFPLIWKKASRTLAKGAIELDGAKDLGNRLNRAFDPQNDVPQDGLVVAAGTTAEVEKKIGHLLANGASGAARYSFYASLEASMEFPYPYAPDIKPLSFVDGQGKSSSVIAFGIPAKAEMKMKEQRAQIRVLYADNPSRPEEFALDLYSSSKPNQLIIAMIKRPANLKDAINRLNERIEWFDRAISKGIEDHGQYELKIDDTDILLAPEIAFQVLHSFKDLEGRRFSDAAGKPHLIVNAQQNIQFNLNRKGASFGSEARMDVDAAPRVFKFDKPFLVLMRTRGHKQPYFAMWVDNSELLRK
jgi:hypothetical protein